ncbi:MAG: hypothetical protein IKG67_03385 [Parasporobacterium sp.]|nr:hypothetical protein [Parasporobacterium sp.]
MGDEDRFENRRVLLIIYTILHFLVDLSCIFFLVGMVYPQLASADVRIHAAIQYNMFAFALPALLGLAADLVGKNAAVSCMGCFMILMSYLMTPGPWVSVVLIGIGNGLFHIGGGRQVLMDSGCVPSGGKKANAVRYAPSGVFIASGAMGVFLGKNMAVAFRQFFYTAMWAALALGTALLLWMAVRQWKKSIRSVLSMQKVSAKMLGLSLLIFLVVIIRSYYGFVAVYSWNHTFLTGLVFTGCIVLGKALGGFAADRLGVTAASVISLGGAGILALFAESIPLMGYLSILLFNMTMPITLTLLTDLWRELPGFAFGVLMLALFLGTLPVMVWHVTWMSSPGGAFGLCMISLVLLLAAVRWMEPKRMVSEG